MVSGRSGRRLSIGLDQAPGSKSNSNAKPTGQEPVLSASDIAAALGMYEVFLLPLNPMFRMRDNAYTK